MDETHILRLEAALTAAVAEHRQALRADLTRQTAGFELRFVLARLGFAPVDLDAVAASTSPADIAPTLRAEIARRLSAESARLLRLARAASPAYDLNRHIAVRRALLWAEGRPVSDDAARTGNISGRILNLRFRRHWPKRRRTEAQSGSDARDPHPSPA